MQSKSVLRLYCSVLFTMCGQGLGQKLNQVCSTFNSSLGRCVRRVDCPSIQQSKDVFKSSKDNDLFSKITLCGSMGVHEEMLVCCPILENSVGCGSSEIEIAMRIYNGNETRPDSHPWAVLLIYSQNGERIRSGCAGSLINDRYVLTAAHCVENIPRGWKLHRVRLSEWDTADSRNCIEMQGDVICKQEFKVQKVIMHENYDRRSNAYLNDIALLKLATKVNFGKFVKPICLPLDKTFQRMNIENIAFTVVGWGETETGLRSGKQRETTLIGKNKRICNEVFRHQGQGIELSDMQLCVGGEDGKDSCRGDSGGPLMQHVNVWYLIGMVSFGERECGKKDHPSVYTNVVPYLDWIENAMI